MRHRALTHRSAAVAELRRLEVFLIRPTKYDGDGYLLRHFRGVLPSNTLACLHALTEDVAARRLLGPVSVRTHLCDESVEAVRDRQIRRAARRNDTRAIVCLVGVQTSQFPRTMDLARRFRALGVSVLVGGFHVSGSLAMLNGTPPELRALLDLGVTLVAGEVETIWDQILRDAAQDTLAPSYNTLAALPVLTNAPIPRLVPQTLQRFVHRHFGTIDASRGCPFSCSFCTIINVQGRSMRARAADRLAAAILDNYRENGTRDYFFTDDDFARNPRWKEIFAALIHLRESEGLPLRFLMQTDLLAHRIPGFVEQAARAGCFQVFLGMESLNPESLRNGGKRQNQVADYAALVEAWHRADILTHVGYIIGFPHDTPDSVRANLRTLRDEVRPDVASFFMLTPLPGSRDHRDLVDSGIALDADLNRYDTFHAVVDHPRMSRDEWDSLYREAWEDFYDMRVLVRQMQQAPEAQRATLLQIYLWYGAAVRVEGFHPMMTGFLRLRPRRDRRSGRAHEGRWRHARRRLPEVAAAVHGYLGLLRGLERVWRQTSVAPSSGAVSRWTEFLRALFSNGSKPIFRYCSGSAVLRCK